MDERDLTDKQRQWLEASARIGPGPMTKSEREELEAIYAEMLPKEQQDLNAYIQERYAEARDAEGTAAMKAMEAMDWKEPSEKLRSVITRGQTLKPPSFDNES